MVTDHWSPLIILMLQRTEDNRVKVPPFSQVDEPKKKKTLTIFSKYQQIPNMYTQQQCFAGRSDLQSRKMNFMENNIQSLSCFPNFISFSDRAGAILTHFYFIFRIFIFYTYILYFIFNIFGRGWCNIDPLLQKSLSWSIQLNQSRQAKLLELINKTSQI